MFVESTPASAERQSKLRTPEASKTRQRSLASKQPFSARSPPTCPDWVGLEDLQNGLKGYMFATARAPFQGRHQKRIPTLGA